MGIFPSRSFVCCGLLVVYGGTGCAYVNVVVCELLVFGVCWRTHFFQNVITALVFSEIIIHNSCN